MKMQIIRELLSFGASQRGSAVECMPLNQLVVGSNPAGFWDFHFLSFLVTEQVPCVGARLLIFFRNLSLSSSAACYKTALMTQMDKDSFETQSKN